MASLLLPSFPSPSSLMDPNTLFKNQRVLWSFCNCLFLTVYHASFFLFEGVYQLMLALGMWRAVCDSASSVSSDFSPCPLLHYDLSFHITGSQAPVNVMTFQLQGSGLIFQP